MTHERFSPDSAQDFSNWLHENGGPHWSVTTIEAARSAFIAGRASQPAANDSVAQHNTDRAPAADEVTGDAGSNPVAVAHCSADIETVALAIEETMFAPHELPVDAELHSKYRGTAIAAIKAMNRTPDAAQPSLVWEPDAGPDANCPYDHTSAATPFGTYRIEWKSWKDYPSCSVEFEGHFVTSENEVPAAKAAAQEDFDKRLRACSIPSTEGNSRG